MNDTCFRIVGIDPGSRCFGLSVIDYDIETGVIHLTHAETFQAERFLNDNSLELVLGDRGARHLKCREFLVERLGHFQPQLVSCESAFMKLKFVTAFQSLVEGIVMARQAVWEYKNTLPLFLVDPPTAKKAVGAPGKGGDKEAVRTAIKKLIREKKIIVNGNVDIDELDEHSIDSIAIGYWLTLKWITELKGII
jgi:Holliday junction resolvasome RuvABC endonuclease subunit